MKRGKIIPNGVSLEKHENDTVVFFTNLGYDVELIPPSNTPKAKTPDFMMNGKAWEMKSPQGKSSTSLEHIFKKATKQSMNVIIDLSHSKMNDKVAVKELTRYFYQTSSCRMLKIITKELKLLELKKQLCYNKIIEGDLAPKVRGQALFLVVFWSILFTQYGYGDNQDGARGTNSYPLDYILSGNGFLDYGLLYYQNNFGHQWSSTLSSNQGAYTFLSARTAARLTGSNKKNYTIPIRCVSR